jgi:hypothetical protein
LRTFRKSGDSDCMEDENTLTLCDYASIQVANRPSRFRSTKFSDLRFRVLLTEDDVWVL